MYLQANFWLGSMRCEAPPPDGFFWMKSACACYHCSQLSTNSFWANAGSAEASKLALHLRVKLLVRTVVPVLDFRCSKWPPQATVAEELDAVQRKMLATILRLRPLPHETFKQFRQRRGKAAQQLCVRRTTSCEPAQICNLLCFIMGYVTQV